MTADRPGLLVNVSAILVLAFLALPILIIFPLALSPSAYLTFPPKGLSLHWVQQVASDPNWLLSLKVSFAVAAMTAVFALALATLAALALTRADVPARRVVLALLLMPMILPGIITSIAVFFFMSRIGLAGSLFGMAVGHTILALPVAVIILCATMQGFDMRLEQAALSLGASRLTAFRRITLPLIAPGFASAAIFAFLSSFDELLMSLFLSGPGQQTLPVRIWSAVLFQLDPTIAAVSALLVLVSIVALGLATLLQRRAPA
jgi:putative spermidine/putrescine transport system permease protein